MFVPASFNLPCLERFDGGEALFFAPYLTAQCIKQFTPSLDQHGIVAELSGSHVNNEPTVNLNPTVLFIGADPCLESCGHELLEQVRTRNGAHPHQTHAEPSAASLFSPGP